MCRLQSRLTSSDLGNVLVSKRESTPVKGSIQAKIKWTEMSANEGNSVSKSHSRPSDSCGH
jgi:hypothetical protein